MKAMSLTRAKRKIKGELRKDFANWIGSHAPRTEVDESGKNIEGNEPSEEKFEEEPIQKQ